MIAGTQIESASDSRRRLVSIDLLRGLAILAVLAIHMPHDAPGGFRNNPWFFVSLLMDYGYMGVHLFVVLSGFCIHRRAALTRSETGVWEIDGWSFWKRRFWRLYPPYVVAIIASLAAAAWFHSGFTIDRASIVQDVCFHLLMLHNLTASFATSLGNGALWSLGMEEQLYLLYFLILFLLRTSTYRRLLLIAGVSTLAWRFLSPDVPYLDLGFVVVGKWYLWPLMFWIHWTLGALAVDAWCGNVTLPRWTRSSAVLVALLGCGIIANRNAMELVGRTGLVESSAWIRWYVHTPQLSTVGELVMAVAFFVMVNVAIDHEDRWLVRNVVCRSIAWLGKISYSVYLIHIPVMNILKQNFVHGSNHWDWLHAVLVFGGCSIAGGCIFYWLVERWFLRGELPCFRLRKPLTVDSLPS